MPNIAITQLCNLHCPYCFAHTMIEEGKDQQQYFMSVEEFISILDWISHNGGYGPEVYPRIGLVGGEPTLHPQFKEIISILINYCRDHSENNQQCVLFSNGIELSKYMYLLDFKYLGLLLNINNPKYLTEEQFKKLETTLQILYDKRVFQKGDARLGCNIFAGETDYSFFFEIAKKYDAPIVRFSVTVPPYVINKREYYNLMKPIFLDFIKLAQKYHIKITPDCNRIPNCYFTPEEFDNMKDVYEPENFFCNATMDLMKNQQASVCFGCYDSFSYKDFTSFIGLEKYLVDNCIYQRRREETDPICLNCKDFQTYNCQGGCLSFLKNQEEKI